MESIQSRGRISDSLTRHRLALQFLQPMLGSHCFVESRGVGSLIETDLIFVCKRIRLIFLIKYLQPGGLLPIFDGSDGKHLCQGQ